MLTVKGLVAVVPAVKNAAPSGEADDRTKQLELLRKAVGDFAATLQHNRPFYADEVFRATEPILDFATNALAMYELGVSETEYILRASREVERVTAVQDQILAAIRTRMREMSVIQR